MKIALIVEFGRNYSGGRYHAWMIALSLVKNHNVDIYCDNTPIFKKDFKDYDDAKNLFFHQIKEFKNTQKKYDWSIIVPSRSSMAFYKEIIITSDRIGSKKCFVNFETPNWYNETFNQKLRYDNLISFLGENCELCISSTKISMDYAKKYFNKYPNLKHEFCYPSINSTAAKKNISSKTNSLVLITRFGKDAFSKHKNVLNLDEMFIDQFSGMNFYVIYSGKINEKKYIERAKKQKINLIFEKSISDDKKFQIIAKSKFLIFASAFEGFGYPPIEALSVNTHVFVKKLEVLEEVNGENLIYFDNKSFSEIKFKNEIYNKIIDYNYYLDFFSVNQYGNRMSLILEKNYTRVKLQKHSFIKHFINFLIKDDFVSKIHYFKKLISK